MVHECAGRLLRQGRIACSSAEVICHQLYLAAHILSVVAPRSNCHRAIAELLDDHPRGNGLDFFPNRGRNNGNCVGQAGLDCRHYARARRNCEDHIVFERNAADCRPTGSLDAHQGHGPCLETTNSTESAIEFRQIERPFAGRLNLPDARRKRAGRKLVDLHGQTRGGAAELVRAKLHVPVRR